MVELGERRGFKVRRRINRQGVEGGREGGGECRRVWSGGCQRGGRNAAFRAFKKLDAFIQRLVERLFLALEHLLDVLLLRANFGEDISHGAGEDADELIEKWFGEAQRATVTHRAAEDATQNIVPIGVTRLDVIRNGEAERADCDRR